MKKLLILAALALLVGIYSFQKTDPEITTPTEEEEGTSVKKIKRKVASIPTPMMNEQAALFAPMGQASYPENEPVNCLNYDGDDICQNEYAAQETFPEESYSPSESEVAQAESAVQEVEEAAPSEVESDANETALFAAHPTAQEE